MKNNTVMQMKEFLAFWQKEGNAPIYPGTMVNDFETFSELVERFVKEAGKQKVCNNQHS